MHNDYNTTGEHVHLINDSRVVVRDWRMTALMVLVIALLAVCIGLTIYNVTLSHNINKLVKQENSVDNTYGWLKDVIQPQMDMSADPCQDFYQYSCGGFVSNTVLPPGVGMYIPTFQTVQEQNYQVMYSIVNDQWPLINDLYSSCMSPPDVLASTTTTTLTNVINNLATSVNSTAATSLFPVVAQLQAMGVDAFFAAGQVDNVFESNTSIYLQLIQSGITQGVNYEDANALAQYAGLIYQSLVSYMATNFTTQRASAVVAIEMQLYNISGNPPSYIEALVNMTWSEFMSIANYDFSQYINFLGLNIANSDTVIISVPSFFEGFGGVISSSSVEAINDYLAWRTYYSLVFAYPVFPQATLDSFSALNIKAPKINAELFNPRNVDHSIVSKDNLRAQAMQDIQLTPAQTTCIDTVDSLLGDFLGLLFTMQVVDGSVENAIHTVTEGVQNSFRNSLPALTWLDDYSKQAAIYKLENIIQIIGHPNKLNRYRGVQLNSVHFLDNILAINQAVFADDMSSVGTPFNRSDYEFPATIVNAFYSPDTNTINFPAGILESPMFSMSFPPMLQYARMGYVIGHETTHGFDNSGRLWNAEGVYEGIFDNATSANFIAQAQCLVNQYSSYQVLPGHYVNGEQTLGENIADLGGAKNAFRAYQAWVASNGTSADATSAKSAIIPSLTNEQLFFVMLGQTWCTKATDQALLNQLVVDVHSPSQFRVNGPLSNFDSFSSAFSCKADTPMNPTNKCVLW